MKLPLLIAILALTLCGCHKNSEKQTFDLETCTLRLQMIDHAKQLWAEQNQKATSDTPTWDDLRSYLRGGNPQCPDGGTYSIGRIGESPSCSIPEHMAHFKNSGK